MMRALPLLLLSFLSTACVLDDDSTDRSDEELAELDEKADSVDTASCPHVRPLNCIGNFRNKAIYDASGTCIVAYACVPGEPETH